MAEKIKCSNCIFRKKENDQVLCIEKRWKKTINQVRFLGTVISDDNKETVCSRFKKAKVQE